MIGGCKSHDYQILYHPGRVNVVVEAWVEEPMVFLLVYLVEVDSDDIIC